MADELTTRLRGLMAEATPGPWTTQYGAGGWADVLMLAQPYNEGDIRLVLEMVNNLPTILARLEAIEAAEGALEMIGRQLNCRGDENAAHYCPNCDNSQWRTREMARATIATLRAAREGTR